jgi:hypothetical protein
VEENLILYVLVTPYIIAVKDVEDMIDQGIDYAAGDIAVQKLVIQKGE